MHEDASVTYIADDAVRDPVSARGLQQSFVPANV